MEIKVPIEVNVASYPSYIIRYCCRVQSVLPLDNGGSVRPTGAEKPSTYDRGRVTDWHRK